jgi:hypothetical protein
VAQQVDPYPIFLLINFFKLTFTIILKKKTKSLKIWLANFVSSYWPSDKFEFETPVIRDIALLGYKIICMSGY